MTRMCILIRLKKCQRGSSWKYRVQQYEINLLKRTRKNQKRMMSGKYKPDPVYEFILNERGKTRCVKAHTINDRVIIKILCENILVPTVSRYLIYDNGASLKHKGVDFTKRRLKEDLRWYYRTNGSNDGYVLLLDFTKYFDNIYHSKLLHEYESIFADRKLLDFLKTNIDSFKVDVSYMSDEEFEFSMDAIFNAIDYMKIDKSVLDGTKLLEKSMGIGNEMSQISGLLYPRKIDNFCKIVKGLHCYGRYMDDTYIIHNSKEYLKEILLEIKDLCERCGVCLNTKKTQIIKLSRGFNFLKSQFILTETGAVICKPSKDAITRERQKLKKYYTKFLEGALTLDEIACSYLSWRGTYDKEQCYYILKNMDALFNDLFFNTLDFYLLNKKERNSVMKDIQKQNLYRY